MRQIQLWLTPSFESDARIRFLLIVYPWQNYMLTQAADWLWSQIYTTRGHSYTTSWEFKKIIQKLKLGTLTNSLSLKLHAEVFGSGSVTLKIHWPQPELIPHQFWQQFPFGQPTGRWRPEALFFLPWIPHVKAPATCWCVNNNCVNCTLWETGNKN